MKYSDAEKLIALLKQRKKQLAQWTDKEYANQRIDEIDCILDVDIDSLQQEQPEMDLENEYQEFCKDYPFPWSSQYVNREYIDELCLSVARHFYGLGLKAKEENK